MDTSVQKVNYRSTVYACFVGYIVQAVINNFVPLLFLTFQSEFGIPLSRITFLITFNFGVQLVVDLVSGLFVDRIGYRAAMILADACCALGLILLAVLPAILPDPYTGLLIAVTVYAVGGGLLEVLVSPIVEACPADNKEKAMSMLHSFYCWGSVGVVLISTVFFHFAGIRNWRILAILWAVVPLVNLVSFTKVPIASLIGEGEKGATLGELFRSSTFWLFMMMMVCAGASEQAVSQWASAFAESGLRITKTLGDLFGPMFFSVMMGLSRVLYGKFGQKMNLIRFMWLSAVLCIASYLLIVLVPDPVIALLGCGFAGFSVGIFWPGTFSLGSAGIRNGGTLMFALYALAGDVGCSGGPTLAGEVAARASGNLRSGIGAALVFPVLMLAGLLILSMRKRRGN
ncbi:MAG: MFS transporter [Firmicutes bacterium]|nr:MFS transporter [Bacillota bacterium]